MDNNLSALIKEQLIILDNEPRDITDRLFEGDRFLNRPTVGWYNLLDIISDKNCLLLSCQFFISAWFFVFDMAILLTVYNAQMILGIGVGISNMVYSTCISRNKNVRDVLATLSMTSILFESLISIGSLMQPSSRFFCTYRYRPSESSLRFLYSW